MNPDIVLKERIWLESTRHSDLPIHLIGMIRPLEVALLYHLARDYYRGFGEIVDAGAFLGKSTKSLALGLRSNPYINDKAGRIHSFDTFIADEKYLYNKIRDRYDSDFKFGYSFRHIFENIISEERDLIKVYEGDFTSSYWIGDPIEILFIYLSKYFKIIDYKVDDSIVFLYKRKMEDDVIQSASKCEYSFDEQLSLMDSAINRLPPDKRHHVELARAFLIKKNLGEEAFHQELHILDEKYPHIEGDPHWSLYRSKFPLF